MDALRDVIDQALYSSFEPPKPAEARARKLAIGQLFRLYGDADPVRAEMYLDATAEIPFEKLALAVRLIVRTHRYPNVPSIAELWEVARKIAGMDRDRYEAGRYLPPSRDWPPEGQRHAIEAGRLEPIAPHLTALESGMRTALPESTDG